MFRMSGVPVGSYGFPGAGHVFGYPAPYPVPQPVPVPNVSQGGKGTVPTIISALTTIVPVLFS